MRTYRIPILLLTVLTLILSACTPKQQEAVQQNSSQPVIAVSILPQQTFIEHIAGDLVTVLVMVPPGQSPATYEPTMQQMQQLSEAEAYLSIGMPFEDAFIPVIRQNLPDLPVIATDETTEKRYFISSHEEEEEEEEDDDHGHEHGAVDPHIWMSPLNVILQAEIITETLVSIDAENEAIYHEGLREFTRELTELDGELEDQLKGLEGTALLVYHPSFGYFADRYGLTQIAVEVGGKEPSPREIENLIRIADEQQVSMVFVQPEYSRKSAQVIADAIGAELVTIAPLDVSYMENLRTITQILKKGSE